MRSIKMILTLAFGFSTTHASATLVPFVDEVFEASLQGDDSTNFREGYVQLNKTQGTISLVLEPRDATREASDYFLEGVKTRVDECDAVIHEAQQAGDQTLRVQLIDYSQYSYERCPSYVPFPETVVQVEQISYGPNETEEKSGYLSATALTPIRY